MGVVACDMPPTDEESFQRLLQEVRKGMPDAESAAQITKGFQKHWDKPPLVELELLGGRRGHLLLVLAIICPARRPGELFGGSGGLGEAVSDH